MNSDKLQSARAAAFAQRWQGRGYEKGESQLFWTELLTEVFGIENPSQFIRFEEQVKVDSTNFIDGHIVSTRVLIEQKSIDKDLRSGIRQSDGSVLNPFQQAKRYVANMPLSQHPRWIVTCNFRQFLVYDMEQPNGEPEEILLQDLGREYYRLQFLVDSGKEHLTKEMQVSMQAGDIVGEIYDALLRQYDDDSPEALRWLNILCVRLVFCLYAEDAGVFQHNQFHDYLNRFAPGQLRSALIALFQTLNTPAAQRDRYLEPELKAFPYTNGGLFDEEIQIPPITEEIKDLLLNNASADFDWSEISPTIFGAVFESTLNPETRRSGGMHYTSIENIHKVIDPLFLNDLRDELDDILEERVERQRQRLLDAYQDKLAALTFLDPACGSGNFLTETYLSLRRLENEALRERYHGQTMLGQFLNPIKVSIHQFYGIEINDFAVTVATTALWISEAQMLAETERIIQQDIDFLPLKSYANIHEGNALRTNWQDVIPPQNLNYIIGNPPFVGGMMMTKEQKQEMHDIMGGVKGEGELDYVCAWYKKAADLIQGTNVSCAFVSTNSITQGQQAVTLWQPLMKQNIHINFAHKTFRWDSEAKLKAHVHCVIVGFSCFDKAEKYIYDDQGRHPVQHINSYLSDAPDVFLSSRSTPLCDVPPMNFGNMPRDGGGFILTEEEKDELLAKEPQAAKWVRLYLGAQEFINGKKRYCLWLVGASPAELRKCPIVLQHIDHVKEYRESSPAASTRKMAETPTLFAQRTQPPGVDYVIVPCVSSERRRYIPMGFMSADTIVSNLVQIIPSATLYHFGVLTSNVHMAWMRVVCGRLKSDYRYSKDIVYNNFPWPEADEETQRAIAATAQAILDARALYPDSSLADLYDERLMPPELRRAHRDNDRAVMRAYGFPTSTTESQCVAALFQRYAASAEGATGK